MSFKTKLSKEKPWAILGISRRRYMASRPWAKIGSRDKFESLLLTIHDNSPELISDMKDHSEADLLVDLVFGEQKEEIM